jgi:hypothetical protein
MTNTNDKDYIQILSALTEWEQCTETKAYSLFIAYYALLHSADNNVCIC